MSASGLVPVLALADRVGLRDLADEQLTVPTDKGAHAGAKVAALVAGMVAGADSIEDMDLLRHGGMSRLFTGIYAPSTLGSFLRSFGFGHVRQLDAVASQFVASLAAAAPALPGAGQIAYLDVDDTVRATYGYAKQGAGYGYCGVKGLNALLAALSTPGAPPVIVATRLRKGSANSARGAARLVADALKTSKACGADGLLVVRADSAFYNRDVIAAIGRAGARFSITARQDKAVRPGHHPRNQCGNLRPGVRALVRRHRQLLLGQCRQTRSVSQCQHRNQPAGRHECRIIEPCLPSPGSVR